MYLFKGCTKTNPYFKAKQKKNILMASTHGYGSLQPWRQPDRQGDIAAISVCSFVSYVNTHRVLSLLWMLALQRESPSWKVTVCCRCRQLNVTRPLLLLSSPSVSHGKSPWTIGYSLAAWGAWKHQTCYGQISDNASVHVVSCVAPYDGIWNCRDSANGDWSKYKKQKAM